MFMEFEEAKKLYLMATKEYEASILNKQSRAFEIIRNILSRGLVGSVNCSTIPFLLTGINPSYDEKSPVNWPGDMKPFCFKLATSETGNTYWTKKRHQFGDLCDEMAYLDLFPIRETHQKNGFERVFKTENDFRGTIIGITQRIIEENLKPKLIVNANRGSIYYWGIRARTRVGIDSNDYVNPWMGYKVERIDPEQFLDIPQCMLTNDRLNLFPIYKIVGFIDSSKRINKELYKTTSLHNSFIMEYVMEYRDKRSCLLYNKDEWREIWEWVMKH